jgi:Zn-dependent M28 family amino/carboxypeptidase
LVAHYDTVLFSPRVNDDFSGVAAVLAAAKMMNQYSFKHIA